MNFHEQSKGFSFYLALGKYKGFKIFRDGPSLFILLGWLSISFSLINFEDLIKTLLDQFKSVDEKDKKAEKLLKEIVEKDNRNNENILKIENRLKYSVKIYEEKIKQYEEENKKYEEKIEDLGNEISDLQDFEAENQELKEKIETLEDRIVELENISSSESSSSEDLEPLDIEYHI